MDWATHAAAKYACENWHYSKCMPKSKLVKIAAWEDGKFIGVIVFGVGATATLVTRYRLKSEEGCELVRVAIKPRHVTPVTRLVKIALKMLRKSNPGIRLVVSFADPEQGHHGGIYQGGGWLYSGKSHPDRMYKIGGCVVHPRSISDRIKAGKMTRAQAEKYRIPNTGKHRYLMAMDQQIRKAIEPLRKPYPKRAGSRDVAATVNHTGEGGSIPTPALHLEKGSFNRKSGVN